MLHTLLSGSNGCQEPSNWPNYRTGLGDVNNWRTDCGWCHMKPTSAMSDAEIVRASKPKAQYYSNTERKSIGRCCLLCGMIISGNFTAIETHGGQDLHKMQQEREDMASKTQEQLDFMGYDYTNQAWIVDGRYKRCGCPPEGTLIDPSQPGGPGGRPFMATKCQCWGRLHEGELVNWNLNYSIH